MSDLVYTDNSSSTGHSSGTLGNDSVNGNNGGANITIGPGNRYRLKETTAGTNLRLEILDKNNIYSFSKPTIVDVSKTNTDFDYNDINDNFYGNYDSIVNPYSTKYIVDYSEDGAYKWTVNSEDFTETIYRSEKDYSHAHYDFESEVASAKKEFESNKAKSDATKKESDNWEFSFSFQYVDEYDYGLVSVLEVVKKAELILNTTCEMNEWMAGGSMYNASFAGDVHFNPTGNISATKFLGEEYTNIDYMFNAREGLLADVHEVLNITAGKGTDYSGTSVFTLMHNAKLAAASNENFIVEESSYTGTTGKTVIDRNNTNDSWEDFVNDVSETLEFEQFEKAGQDIGKFVEDIFKW